VLQHAPDHLDKTGKTVSWLFCETGPSACLTETRVVTIVFSGSMMEIKTCSR